MPAFRYDTAKRAASLRLHIFSPITHSPHGAVASSFEPRLGLAFTPPAQAVTTRGHGGRAIVKNIAAYLVSRLHDGPPFIIPCITLAAPAPPCLFRPLNEASSCLRFRHLLHGKPDVAPSVTHSRKRDVSFWEREWRGRTILTWAVTGSMAFVIFTRT